MAISAWFISIAVITRRPYGYKPCQYGGNSRRNPCAITISANSIFRSRRPGQNRETVSPQPEQSLMDWDNCSASRLIQATDLGQSSSLSIQDEGIAFGPSDAPSNPPTMAAVVSVSPPSRTAASTPARKSSAYRSQQNVTIGTVCITYPLTPSVRPIRVAKSYGPSRSPAHRTASNNSRLSSGSCMCSLRAWLNQTVSIPSGCRDSKRTAACAAQCNGECSLLRSGVCVSYPR